MSVLIIVFLLRSCVYVKSLFSVSIYDVLGPSATEYISTRRIELRGRLPAHAVSLLKLSRDCPT